jgi:hypothetical protein
MKRFLGAILAAAFLSIIFSGVVLSQDRNLISGFVFDDSRAPVADVYVELLSDFYSTISRVRTKGSGQFSFAGLPPGQYYVKVLTAGTNFEEQTRSVSLVPLSVIQGRGITSEFLDFYLKPRRSRPTTETAPPGVVFGQEVPTEASDLYTSALVDLEAKKDQAAFDKLKRSIEIYPDYFLALDRLGNEYVNRGYYEPAHLLLAKAISVNQRSVSSAFGLGLALFRLGHVDKAIEQFQTVLSLDPSSANGHLWLGIALHEKKKYPEALRSLLKANELSNGSVAEVHWQLARVYKDQNRFDKSADELELFLKYNPDAKNFDEIKQIITRLRERK